MEWSACQASVGERLNRAMDRYFRLWKEYRPGPSLGPGAVPGHACWPHRRSQPLQPTQIDASGRLGGRRAQGYPTQHVVSQRVPQRDRLTLTTPRTSNCTSPRPRACAFTHSAVAARSL